MNSLIPSPSFVVTIIVWLMLGATVPAQAILIDRGLFDDGQGGMMNLIYDEDFDITWLGNANFGAGSVFDDGLSSSDGRMTWNSAVNWAASLTVGGFTDWHLPLTIFPDSGCASGSSQTQQRALGNNCTLSHLGHLYYTELGNSANGPLLQKGPFKNLQEFFYWSGTRYTFAPNAAYNLNFSSGWQDANGLSGQFNALALRNGDVLTAPIPEPSTIILFGSGLAVLGVWRYRRTVKV